MQLTRRYFLQSSGALAAYLGVAPFSVLGASGAGRIEPTTVRRRKTLVTIFLRGGADGLNLVVPFGDPHYAALRPRIAIPAPGGEGDRNAIDLDGRFALHPSLAALKPMFDDGTAVALHAVGYAKNTRSHFEEQDTWETGIVGNTVGSDGWLNRHLATSQGRGEIRAVTIGDALPRILHGKAPAYALRGLDDLVVPGSKHASPDRISAALEHAYCVDGGARASLRSSAGDLLAQSAGITLAGMEGLRRLAKEDYKPDAEYPATDLARRLMQVARLIKADLGVEVAQVDFGGWDTHQNQGFGPVGAFSNLAEQLSGAVAAFHKDLGDRMEDVVVVTLTDFGRTAAENGTAGTDHGWANCMLLCGGAVKRANDAVASAGKARKVAGRWPGLAPDQLHEKRDLAHTTDFRDVLGELVATHLGNPNIRAVLPSHEFAPVGVVA